MKMTFKTEGFIEMDKALDAFAPATGKNILRRAGMAALQPMAATMRANAPRQAGGDNDLADSIDVGTKLNKRQKKLNRGVDVVEIYVGPSGQGGENAPPQGTQQEFGNENHGPQPFARPALDQHIGGLLEGLAVEMRPEIDKATGRAQRKALKARR